MSVTNINLVNYNSSNHTIDCLESLKLQISSKFRVWLIDNSNKPSETEVILKYLYESSKPLSDEVSNKKFRSYDITGNNEVTELFFHKAKSNLGYAAAINVALRDILRFYPDEYVWKLYIDILLTDDASKPLIDKLESSGNYVTIGSSLYTDKLMRTAECFAGGVVSKVTGLSNHCNFIPDSCDGREAYVEDRINYLMGSSVFFKAWLVEAVGLFLVYNLVLGLYVLQLQELGKEWRSRAVNLNNGEQ